MVADSSFLPVELEFVIPLKIKLLNENNCRYSQAGTPVVKVTTNYNTEGRTFSLKFR